MGCGALEMIISGKRILLTIGSLGLMTVGTSCMSTSHNALTQVRPPSTERKAGATVHSGPLQDASSVGSSEFPVREPRLGVREGAGKPSKKKGFELASTETPPDTSFNFPSMVGSNLLVRTTAYSHLEEDSLPYGKLNAAGGVLQYGGSIRSAAADWSRFPLGTRFRIKGMPYTFIVDDYGSALVGTNTIDIYKPTIAAMNKWGVKHVEIEILEWGCFHKSHEILDGRKHVEGADHVRQMLRDIETRYTSDFSSASLFRVDHYACGV